MRFYPFVVVLGTSVLVDEFDAAIFAFLLYHLHLPTLSVVLFAVMVGPHFSGYDLAFCMRVFSWCCFLVFDGVVVRVGLCELGVGILK